jgi:cellulose synthase/poly-beta-1,6-N-acetylglucosamine synthase-like glycosyltransferase
MKIFLFIALVFYCITTLFIFCYTLLQFHLTIAYIISKKKKKLVIEGMSLSKDDVFVTVQLPLYNEPYVTERLINAVCAFDYPKNL